MAYNTGNAPGSTSPKDLIDNAEDFDLLLTGGSAAVPNRLGVPLKSWKGMEGEHNSDQIRREGEFDSAQAGRAVAFDVSQLFRKDQFNTFMAASGYEAPIPYGPGIDFIRTTQTVTYLGNEYRAKSANIPFTTTNWAADEAKLKLIGDDSLRQSLANSLDSTLGAAMVGRRRSKLARQIDAINQTLDTLAFNPWEKEYLVTDKPDPEDSTTWDWQPAIQALINEAWTWAKSGLTFNNGKSASMQAINLGGMTYGLRSSLSLPTGAGTSGDPAGGAGGSFRMTSGGFVALSGFPANTPMLRVSSVNNFYWTQGTYWDHLEFDGAGHADWCIEAQKSAGTFVSYCRMTRYKKRALTTSDSAFNVIVSHCYIEAAPYLSTETSAEAIARRSFIPECGVYFGSPDCMLISSVVIGNLYGVRTAGRTRVHDNHLYGNKYAVLVTSQYTVASGNYLEGPVLATNSFADNSWVNNLFSNSATGGCFLSPDDGLGQLRGAAIHANIRSNPVLLAAGTITLSGTTGLITISSSASDFNNYIGNGQTPDGAIIAAGGAYAVVVDAVTNSLTQVSARVVGTFSGTSFAPGSWTQRPSRIALSETTFGPVTAYNVNATASIQEFGNAVNDQSTFRLFYNNGGTLGVISRNLYDRSVGDGRGDVWFGNTSATAPVGLAFGVLTSGANGGSSAIWARGSLEQLSISGYSAGRFVLFNASVWAPGVDGATSIGNGSLRINNYYGVNSPIISSDRNLKQDIRDIEEVEARVARSIKPKAYRMRAAVAEKGDRARIHFGVIAQDVLAAFAAEGLDAHDYGLFCYDEWEDEFEDVMQKVPVLDDDGLPKLDENNDPLNEMVATGEKRLVREAGSRYSIRYDELRMFQDAAR